MEGEVIDDLDGSIESAIYVLTSHCSASRLPITSSPGARVPPPPPKNGPSGQHLLPGVCRVQSGPRSYCNFLPFEISISSCKPGLSSSLA